MLTPEWTLATSISSRMPIDRSSTSRPWSGSMIVTSLRRWRWIMAFKEGSFSQTAKTAPSAEQVKKKTNQNQRKPATKHNQTQLETLRKPTNWWGSAKRDDTPRGSTVVYNACYHLFRKGLCTPMCIWAHSYVRRERDSNTKIAIRAMLRRWRVHTSHISGVG